jgi:hypothetical protein
MEQRATFLRLARWLGPGAPQPPATVSDADWDQFLALAERHRVTPALARAAQRDGVRPAARHQAALDGALRHAALDELALAASARAIAQAFAIAQLPVGILKGVPLSLEIHGSLGHRVSRDIDLLVAPARIADALDQLARLGFHPQDPGIVATPARRARLIRWHKDIELVHAGRRQIVELHWRLFDNPHLLPLAQPWPLVPADLPMDLACLVLPAPVNLRYLALHGAQHGWSRLKWLLDFAALLARHDPAAREEAWRATAIRDGRRAFGQALILCDDLLGLALRPAFRRELLSDRRIGWLVGIALNCMAGGAERELESRRFGSTMKNAGHYLLSSAPAYLAAEARFDLADMSATRPGSLWRHLGPLGRLGAWASRRMIGSG